MHKRILAIFVALVLLISICVIPAAADSADEDLPYVELTKYDDGLVAGIVPGAFYVLGDYGYVLDFSLTLVQLNGYGYEITYSWSGNRPNVTGVSFGDKTDNNFISRYVGDTNIGKIRGTFNGSVGSNLGISFNSTGCYITVHSVRVFLAENFQVELSAYLYGDSSSGATYTPGSSVTVSNMGYTTVSIDDWRNYDVINLSASLGGVALTSVSARLMDNTSESSSDTYVNVPIDMSYANYSDYSGSQDFIFLNVSCDMRGVDPATAPDSTLYIYITSTVPSGQYGNLRVTSVSGYILIDGPDAYLSWFKAFAVQMAGQYELSDEILSSIGAISLNLKDQFRILSDGISALTESMNLAFSDFKSFWSSSLDEKLDSLRVKIAEIEANKWQYLFSPAFQTIFEKLDAINNGTPVDPSVSQGMTSAGQELADLGQAMVAGTPQVSTQVQVSVPDVPDDGSGVLATTMFNFFWQQDYILKMLLTVVALATISYIFFGKKG